MEQILVPAVKLVEHGVEADSPQQTAEGREGEHAVIRLSIPRHTSLFHVSSSPSSSFTVTASRSAQPRPMPDTASRVAQPHPMPVTATFK